MADPALPGTPATCLDEAQERVTLIAVGTYTQAMPHVDGKGLGIHVLAFDAAQASLRAVSVAAGVANPSYLCVSAAGERVYCVRELDASCRPGVDVYARAAGSPQLRLLARLDTPGAHPCHLSVNELARQLYVANYGSGEVLVYALDADGVPGPAPVVLARRGSGPRQDRQDGPHAHCAVADDGGHNLYVCDLGVDAVVRHPIGPQGVAAQPDLTLPVQPGAGPRHLAFSADGRLLFVINELNSTLAMYGRYQNAWRLLDVASTLPADWSGANTAGALRMHPNGRWVYASNRGHDSLVGLRIDTASGKLTPMGWWPAGGRTPRDFTLTADGAFLLAASQDDNLIRPYWIHPVMGHLVPAAADHPVPSPACLCILP